MFLTIKLFPFFILVLNLIRNYIIIIFLILLLPFQTSLQNQFCISVLHSQICSRIVRGRQEGAVAALPMTKNLFEKGHFLAFQMAWTCIFLWPNSLCLQSHHPGYSSADVLIFYCTSPYISKLSSIKLLKTSILV